MPSSYFIKSMHPKTSILPERSTIQRILKLGWVGQKKIHGHRAQFHLSSSTDEIFAYNRHGQQHKKKIPADLKNLLYEYMPVSEGWTVLDCEWLKKEGLVYVFDVLKHNGTALNHLSYRERFEFLPRFTKHSVQTLPLIRSVDKCLEVLDSNEPYIEGLVFKSLSSKGFKDTSIIRCRKSGIVYS